MKVTTFDFDNVDQARLFINGLTYDGKPVDYVVLASGEEIELAMLTDEDVGHVAAMIYRDLMNGDSGLTWSARALN